jgi:hypothetical protein
MGINQNVGATSPQKQDADPEILRLVRDALDRLRFGSIHLTIHEGKLVQIDVTEKTRLPA